MKEIEIPENLRPIIDEIAERLWSDHAAVMIGSGFSKNAEPLDVAKRAFPDWDELAKKLHEKAHGVDCKNCNSLDPIRLAQEVEALFGRSVLDILLKQSICDMDCSPGNLFHQLLSLPWVDVFTTNYDTLLERAAEKVTSSRYTTTSSCKGLAFADSPRIIKLHGSFPDNPPFIITEEDYRTYPHRFAPFVNTVQQTLLENCLCMIGFSGNDPNFLSWIGWVRDNLGADNCPKIFYIGFLEKLPLSRRRALELKNIVLVDISQLVETETANKYNNALFQFFEELYRIGDAKINQTWPSSLFLSVFRGMKYRPALQDPKNVRALTENRVAYPGRYVVSEEVRRELTPLLLDVLNSLFYDLSRDVAFPIDLLYEIDWLTSLCFLPILHPDIVKAYEDGINANLNGTPEQQAMVAQLGLSLLRHYRDDDREDEWNVLIDRISSLSLNNENKAEIYLERCLFALNQMDYPKLRELLNKPPSDMLPHQRFRYGSLLAELGQTDKAFQEYDRVLEETRKLACKDGPEYGPSVEAYLLAVYGIRPHLTRWEKGKEASKAAEKNIERNTMRLKDLKRMGFSLWDDVNSLADCIPENTDLTEAWNHPDKEYHPAFDLDDYRGEEKQDKTFETALSAFAYLRFREAAGIPFTFGRFGYNREHLAKCLDILLHYSPYTATSLAIRYNQKDAIKKSWNRAILGIHAQEDINRIGERLIDLLPLSFAKQEDVAGIPVGFLESMRGILPEALSRLLSRLSISHYRTILDHLKNLYQNGSFYHDCDVSPIIERMVEVWPRNQRTEMINRFLEFGILSITEFRSNFPEPFISVDKLNPVSQEVPTLPEHHREALMKLVGSDRTEERKRAIFRLLFFIDQKKLDMPFVKEFLDSVFAQLNEETGLPQLGNFYPTLFVDTVHYPEYDYHENLRDFIMKYQLPALGESADVFNAQFQVNELVNLLLNALPDHDQKLQPPWLLGDYPLLLNRILDWALGICPYLSDTTNHMFFKVDVEVREALTQLQRAICFRLLPRLEKNLEKSLKKKLKELEAQLTKHRVQPVAFYAATTTVFPSRKTEALKRLHQAITSTDFEEVIDATIAIKTLAVIESIKKGSVHHNSLNPLIEKLQWRREPALSYCVSLVASLIDKYKVKPSHKQIRLIEDSLGSLLQETVTTKTPTPIPPILRFDLRCYSARLASSLYRYKAANGIKTPGSILNEWREVCQSVDELAEVRNQWSEKIDLE